MIKSSRWSGNHHEDAVKQRNPVPQGINQDIQNRRFYLGWLVMSDVLVTHYQGNQSR